MTSSRSGRSSRAALAVVALLSGALAPVARGQSPDTTSQRSVAGHVTVQRNNGPVPVAGSWVTLHRVAGDSAGPLDSVRTDAKGEYAIRYRAYGSPDAIYFVSTRFGGVAYFSSPLRGANVRGDAAALDVFDTTTAPVPTTVRGRHLIVSAADAAGGREVIEVYEISNDTSVTMLDRESAAGGTWSATVPANAQAFKVRDGEIPSDALVRSGTKAVLRMPFAPGLKQVAFSYTLAAEAFPLAVTAEQATSVFEVLVEDGRAQVSGGSLTAVQPVVVEGRSFRRFLAQDVPAGSSITIEAPLPEPSWTRWLVPGVLGVLGLGMVSALAFPRRRRGAVHRARKAVPRPVSPGPNDGAELSPAAALVARRIAVLDDDFARAASPTDAERDAYERSRAALKSELAEALGAASAGDGLAAVDR